MNPTQQGRSKLSRGLVALALSSLLVASPGTSLCQDAFKPPSVSSIEIDGNRVFSDGTLKKVMRTKERSYLRPFRKSVYRKDFLSADIESILGMYRRHGYLKAKLLSERVERSSRGNSVSIHLEFVEGPMVVVRSVSIDGEAALQEARLAKGLKLQPGGPFSPVAVEEDRQSILEKYAEAGYFYATVSDNAVFDGDLADANYVVSEGIQAVAGGVSVQGNKTVAERLVRREVTFKQGDVLKRSQLVETQQRIFDSGLFSDVDLSPVNADSVVPVVDLVVRVKERKMSWVGTGIGYGSSDQLKVFGEWGHRNVGGMGRRLVSSAEVAFGRRWLAEGEAVLDQSRLEVGFVEPWLFGTRTAGQLVAYHEYKKEAAFSQDFDGVTFTAKRDLSSFSKVYLSYDNRWVNTTDPTAIRDEYVTRSLYLSGTRDLRDDIFDPGRGSYQESSWKVAGGALGGNYSFHKLSFSSSWYTPAGSAVVAARFKVGYEEPFGRTFGVSPLERVPFEERFRTGGAMSVRGYLEDDEIGPRDSSGNIAGGRFLILSNVEVRFPLFWRLSGAVFFDGGNVWANPSDIKTGQFSLRGATAGDADYRYSYGGGLRLRTPVGPIRVDYGRKLKLSPYDEGDRGQFHFSLGQAF
ncbi:MAG: outer membrane protein assembly factor BamA [Candidatus Eisenbacteria bacterium]|nr:outer membrane protein assembly factor BamA [Candidatus Eisenbacteria bacterium]